MLSDPSLSQRIAYSKATLDDSLSTIDTTSRDQTVLIAPWLEAINKSFLKVKI